LRARHLLISTWSLPSPPSKLPTNRPPSSHQSLSKLPMINPYKWRLSQAPWRR
jgi:hypothetical protein